MNRTEAEALLAAGVGDAEELVRRWMAMSADERLGVTLDERERFRTAWERVAAWPSASARARQVLELPPAHQADTLEAAAARRRRVPRDHLVKARDAEDVRRLMAPLVEEGAEPDVVDSLGELVCGPGWLRGERP